MIAEAAASVPWVVFDGRARAAAPSGLALINRPDPNGAGDGFFETLYGHLCCRATAGSTRWRRAGGWPGCGCSGPTGCG
jgi:phage portal protein BeeE